MLFIELLGQELSWCGMLWGQDDLGTQAVWTRFNGFCFFLRASYMLMGCKTPMVWKSGLFLPCSLEPPLCKPITSPNIDEANRARCSTRENGQLTVAAQPGRPPLKQLEVNPPHGLYGIKQWFQGPDNISMTSGSGSRMGCALPWVWNMTRICDFRVLKLWP